VLVEQVYQSADALAYALTTSLVCSFAARHQHGMPPAQPTLEVIAHGSLLRPACSTGTAFSAHSMTVGSMQLRQPAADGLEFRIALRCNAAAPTLELCSKSCVALLERVSLPGIIKRARLRALSRGWLPTAFNLQCSAHLLNNSVLKMDKHDFRCKICSSIHGPCIKRAV
jgi:hypothetical protein